MLSAAQRHTVIRLIARRVVRDRISKDRHAVIRVLLGRGPVRIRRSDPHLVSRLLQAPAQAFDVHLGAADAVWKIPAEQMNDLHAGPVTVSRPREAGVARRGSRCRRSAFVASRRRAMRTGGSRTAASRATTTARAVCETAPDATGAGAHREAGHG